MRIRLEIVFTPMVRRIGARLVAGLFYLATTTAFSQANPSDWLVRSWQSEDGLPDSSVEAVAQTSDGYLWVGMQSGLARFDGLRFETVNLTNIVAFPNRGVINLLRDRNGAVWMAMDRGGVVRLQGNASRAFKAGLPKDIPNGLAEDDAGSVWVAYRSGAVFRIQGNRIMRCAASQGFPEGSDISALTTDKQGRLWFAKEGRIGIYCNGRYQTLCRMGCSGMRLAAARDGGVWLYAGSRLYKSDAHEVFREVASFPADQANMRATVMLEDHQGAVWLGTAYNGLFRFDGSGFNSVPTTHRGILSLMEDRQHNLWVGTSGGGLDRISPRAITLQGSEAGLTFPAIQSICQSTDGMLWAALQNGDLARLKNGLWQTLPISTNWAGQATCVAADTNGTIWVGSRHGLDCWRAGHFVNWEEPPALKDKTFHTILIDKNGDLWLGQESPSAVLRLHACRVQNFSVPAGNRIIRAMTQDAAGNIWAGTSKGTLFEVKEEQISEVTPRPVNDLAPIRCLAATSDGAVWIGYAGWGVGCVVSGHYHTFNQADGLYDNYISEIIADGHGWMWFASNRGLFKVHQVEFQAVINGQKSRVRSIHYGRSEGLPSLQAPYGDAPNVLRSFDGRLWLPMQTVVAVVNPVKLDNTSEPPLPLLTSVRVDDRTVASYRGMLPCPTAESTVADLAAHVVKLELPPGNRHIEIQFTAPDFTTPENIQFRYRLKGLDDNWVDAGSQRSASYSHLAAGSYKFDVAACNNVGEWNQSSASLDFLVAPFYWQTWWFRLAAFAAFTLAIILGVRYVSFRRLQRQLRLLEQQAALQRERARIAKDIHDDLGANLTQIAYLGELAQMDRHEPDKAAARVTKMSATARQTIKALDEIVWAVNPRNDTLAHLIDYTGQFTVDYLRLADIRVRLDFPTQIPLRELSTDLRHNIFLTVKEALHNIVKHAGATDVWVRVSLTAEALEISVEDNGRGFAMEPNDATADGLRNMRQRMADIGGECHVESRHGHGTKMRLRLPWPNLKG